tara:strand:- start:53 stop:238 length:186 start_codon:yes stop_codon:yes gene_type:complete
LARRGLDCSRIERKGRRGWDGNSLKRSRKERQDWKEFDRRGTNGTNRKVAEGNRKERQERN